MFAGSREQLRLRFDRSLAGVVIDRFGRGTPCVPDGPDAFICTVEVAVSPNFSAGLPHSARGRSCSPLPRPGGVRRPVPGGRDGKYLN